MAKPSNDRLCVTLTQFAGLCGVSSSTAHEWKEAGMPCNGGGKRGKTVDVFLDEALPWVIERLARPPEYESERERKAGVEADILEIKKAQMQGTIFDIDTLTGVFAGAITELNAALDTRAAKLCRDVAGLDDVGRIRAVLREDSRGIRQCFAAALAELAERCAVLAEDVSARYAGAVSNARSVGRRKAKTTARKSRSEVSGK